MGVRASRSRGPCPSRWCSACGQVQGAPGRGKRARGAPLTFRCLQISRGRCSAWLGHVSPWTRASLARHGALRAGHPRGGWPGWRGEGLCSWNLAGSAPGARPLRRRGPGPPGPRPRSAARVPLARLSYSHEEAAARRAPGTPARLLARRSAAPATATRLRAPPMSSFTAIVFGEISEPGPGGGGGAGEGAEGSPCGGPGSQRLREQAAGGEGTGAARPSRAPGWHRGGRSPGPAGGRRGRRRARGAGCVGWGIRRERRSPRPWTPAPQPEPEAAGEGAAGAACAPAAPRRARGLSGL